MPIRIQRKRTKGWKMPPDTVYVGRGSRWGNPFVIGKDGDARQCIKRYVDMLLPYSHRGENATVEKFMISEIVLEEIMLELAGKNLACWCGPDQECHADVLLKLATPPPSAPD